MMRSSILIIDDKPEDLAQLSMPLIRKGIHVRVANNGMTGSQLAAIHKPDLILLDVHMPNINGFSVAKLLLNHDKTKHIPIMFITSANDDASRIEGLSIGAMDYIIKPFNTQEVLLRIDIQLRLHHKESVPKEIESIELLSGCTLFKQPSDWEDALLKNIIQHYKTRISQPSTIKEVANIYGINEKKLNYIFQETFNMSLSCWIRKYRMKLSCQMLMSKNLTIGQISEQLGYASQAYFTKTFRDTYGCTPSEYIEKNKNE